MTTSISHLNNEGLCRPLARWMTLSVKAFGREILFVTLALLACQKFVTNPRSNS